MTYVIAVTNGPPGRFPDETAGGEAEALARARDWSAEPGMRRLAVTVYQIRGDGAYAIAVYLNGVRRFTGVLAGWREAPGIPRFGADDPDV